MKHGDKKAKSAKAVSQASGKESSSKAGGTRFVAKSAGQKAGSQAESRGKKPPASKEAAAPSGSSSKKGGSAPKAGQAAGKIEGVSFTNPLVAAGFRRAVKKYPTAFRRLSD
jgi:hypothetical protein